MAQSETDWVLVLGKLNVILSVFFWAIRKGARAMVQVSYQTFTCISSFLHQHNVISISWHINILKLFSMVSHLHTWAPVSLNQKASPHRSHRMLELCTSEQPGHEDGKGPLLLALEQKELSPQGSRPWSQPLNWYVAECWQIHNHDETTTDVHSALSDHGQGTVIYIMQQSYFNKQQNETRWQLRVSSKTTDILTQSLCNEAYSYNPAKIWIRYLSNTSLKCYWYTDLLYFRSGKETRSE